MKRAAGGATLLLALLLSGCGSITEESVGSFWVSPGKYQYHDCKQLISTEQAHRQRTKDLEELMAKAALSLGGEVIGTLAYRTEYQQAIGEQKVAAAAIVEKRCLEERSSTSARSVF